MTIPFVGKCFPKATDFLAYLETIKFGSWTPKFITMHHTGGPSLATWKTYAHGTRKVPITDARWMANLAGYYERLKARPAYAKHVALPLT